MSKWIEPEINDPQADLLLVGRDLGRNEVQQGRPFVGRAGKLLDQALTEAGINRSSLNITNLVNKRPPNNNFKAHANAVIERGRQELRDLIERLDPNCIVALGNEAAYALVEDWPTSGNGIRGAKGIRERRGFIFESVDNRKVVATVHPSFCLRSWVPWRALLTMDLERANDESEFSDLDRPERRVSVPTDRDEAQHHAQRLARHDRLAADIEIRDADTLACIGFAPSRREAVVFPARYLEECTGLLGRDGPDLIWHNGQFDKYFLKSRCGIDPPVDEDSILAWHACYPELAGSSATKSYKTSRKGLAFLASLFTRDRWWKNYSFEGDHEMYELNGIDCCVTYEVWLKVIEEIEDLGVEEIYRHNLSLVPVVVDMLDRGLKVDEAKRQKRVRQLSEREKKLEEEVNEICEPIVHEHADRLEDVWHLFEVGGFKTESGRRETCPCCNGGAKKSEHCTDCAGIDGTGSKGAIVKDDLVRWAQGRDLDTDGLTKQELMELVPECEVCEGDGKRTEFRINPRSKTQMKAVIYDALKLPKRYEDGSLSVSEDSLKSILATLN